MRKLALVVALGAAACAADDGSWVVRPPGGGPGTIGDPPIDAARPIDADGDGGVGLRGLICVVADLRMPDACPASGFAAGQLVRKLGDTDGATSDTDGRFTLAVTDPTVILDVASGATTLQASLIPVVNDGTLVQAPVPTKAAWAATLTAAATVVAPGNGSIALYVDDATGVAAPGVTIDLPAGAVVGPFYDRAGGAWTIGGGTGPAGVALITDLPEGSYTVTGRNAGGAQLAIAGVPVAADRVTFIRGRVR